MAEIDAADHARRYCNCIALSPVGIWSGILPGTFFMIMVYQFDIEVASRFGVNEAIMIYNLAYWIRKNEANGKHLHDGRYWTYNSVKAFAELFPFWTKAQVRRILESLVEKGVIVTGNYNEDGRDRTIWYAFSDAYVQNQQMHLSKLANANAENDKCVSISNNNIDTNTNVKQANSIIAPEGALFPDSIEISKKNKGTTEPLCLFADSKFADVDAFCNALAQEERAGIDLAYYYASVRDWSAGGGKKKRDWIATARNFMRSDKRDGKLVMVQGACSLSEDALRYLNNMQNLRV